MKGRTMVDLLVSAGAAPISTTGKITDMGESVFEQLIDELREAQARQELYYESDPKAIEALRFLKR